jgi:seryl-tRNA synthetase
MRRRLCCTPMLLLALVSPPAVAQDVAGLQNCMAEKQIERRTGCFQSNDDFLQHTLAKQTRDMQAGIAASGRDLAAAKAEIAALKSALDKLAGEMAQLKAKVEAGGKK